MEEGMSTALRWLEDKRLEYLLVILVFLALTLIFFWPLPAHLTDGLSTEHGDPLFSARLIAWNGDNLIKHPTKLFQVNFLYPSRDVLAYSDHHITLGILGMPFYHLTKNMAFTYNVLFILGYVFSAFGCYLLVKHLTGSRWGALVGGLFFAFCPYKIAQANHINIFFLPFLPLMLLFLFKYMESGSRKHLVLSGVFFLAQSLVGWHHALFCVILYSLFWAFQAVFYRDEGKWNKLGCLVLVFLFVAVILTLPSIPYIKAMKRLPGFKRSTTDMRNFSAWPSDFLRVPTQNLLYGKLVHMGKDPTSSCEWILFPGGIVPILALLCFFLFRKRHEVDINHVPTGPGKTVLFFSILTLLGLIYLFGPKIGGITNPLFYFTFLGNRLSFIRVPTRFYALFSFGLAVLSGFGLSFLLRALAPRIRNPQLLRAPALLTASLLIAELFTFGIPVAAVPNAWNMEPVYQWLKRQDGCVIVELPTLPIEHVGLVNTEEFLFKPQDTWKFHFLECRSIYLGGYHKQKTVNGSSGYLPFFYFRTIAEAQAFPSPRSVQLLSGLGVDYVIWHWDRLDEGMREEYERLLSSAVGIAPVIDFGDQVVYRLLPVEKAEAGDIELEMLLPRQVPAGEKFNLGLVATNTSSKPYVLALEDRQPFSLSFLDYRDQVVKEVKGSFHAPFFLQEGERIAIALQAGDTPPPGEYAVELNLEEGIFSPRSFRGAISVCEQKKAIGSGLVHGELHFLADSPKMVAPYTDGLIPLTVEATNSGENQWKCDWNDDEVESYPYGLVWIVTTWFKDHQQITELSAQELPCDVSAGQSVLVPLLVRLPKDPGDYVLVIQAFDYIHGTFGLPKEMGVEVRRE